jgi:hypothetical protein
MASRIRDLFGGGNQRPEGVVQHTVGNALVVHSDDKISAEAQSLALSMIEDVENDVVVLDLGDGMPISMWESMAGVLPRRRRGIRLVACGQHRNSAAMAGQWLSERLNRTVIAPDGDLVRGSAGALFVHSAPGSGWVRFRPGRPPTWDAKRYPTPLWDSAAIDTKPSSATGEIEPIPAGVWIHSNREPEVVEPHRQVLTAYVPCRPDTMTVLLGCPGTPPLSLDDVVRFWRELDAENRERVRFVQFGEVRMPEGEAFGQALADLLETSLTCYTGVPIGGPQKYEIRSVLSDGTLGWAPFALELSYVPRAHPNSRARRPSVVSHRPPLSEAEEIAPRVYWFAPGAVVEVVQTGLWVRSTEEPKNAEQVRAAMLDAEGGTLVFDDTVYSATNRMRELAVDLAARIDGMASSGSALMPASVLVPGAKPASRAQAVIDLEEETRKVATAAPKPAYVDIVPPAPVAPATASNVVVTSISLPVARLGIKAPVEEPAAQERLQVLPVPQPTPPPPTLAGLAAGRQLAAPEPPAAPAPVPVPAPAEPVVFVVPEPPTMPAGFGEPAPPTMPAGFGEPVPVESSPPPSPPPELHPPVPIETAVTETAVAETAMVESAVTDEAEAEEAPTAEPRLQPVPSAGASALRPEKKGLADERAWLRRTLSREFDVMASSVSRILSEHPGMQGSELSTEDVLADAVALRLYLSGRGPGVDAGLRSGRKGPHVPFARCVVAGLSRMPSFRGTTIYRLSPSDAEWELYQDRRLITDWGFVNGLTQPCSTEDGDTDVLIWSMTARRTSVLEPDDDEHIEDRVLFLPGTNFKVLELRRPAGDERGAVLMREIGANEIDDDGRVAADRVSLDELAVTSLRRSVDRWATPEPRERIGARARGRLRVLPGLDRKE